MARLDRKRPRKGSNEEWVNPYEPDAEITKMKDGRTHLAHKQENAVDLETGAIVGVTLTGGAQGDTKTIGKTIEEADENLQEVKSDADEKTTKRMAEQIHEVVADKGYHSNDVLMSLEELEIRSYVSEPDRGRRNWKGKADAREAVYANRRRIRGNRGKALLRSRGELLERPFAHTLETGAMRRTHLRRHENILKRLLIHVSGANISLLMRTLFGVGKPRVLQGKSGLLAAITRVLAALVTHWRRIRRILAGTPLPARADGTGQMNPPRHPFAPLGSLTAGYTTGC